MLFRNLFARLRKKALRRPLPYKVVFDERAAYRVVASEGIVIFTPDDGVPRATIVLTHSHDRAPTWFCSLHGGSTAHEASADCSHIEQAFALVKSCFGDAMPMAVKEVGRV
jgi:hypothetical protein